MRTWEVMLEWDAGDLVACGYMLRSAPNAALAMISARGFTAFYARIATMQVRVLRVRRVRQAEEQVLRQVGVPRPLATPKVNLREYPGQSEQEEKV